MAIWSTFHRGLLDRIPSFCTSPQIRSTSFLRKEPIPRTLLVSLLRYFFPFPPLSIFSILLFMIVPLDKYFSWVETTNEVTLKLEHLQLENRTLSIPLLPSGEDAEPVLKYQLSLPQGPLYSRVTVEAESTLRIKPTKCLGASYWLL